MHAKWIYSTLFKQFYLQNNIRSPSNGFFRVHLKTVPYTIPALWQNMLSWHSLNGVHSISPSNHEFTGVNVQSEDTIWKENLTDTARTASISSKEPARKNSNKIFGLNILIMLHALSFAYAKKLGSRPQFYVEFAPAYRHFFEFSFHLNSYPYFCQANQLAD